MTRVLVVEDNATIRESLGDLFAMEGFEPVLTGHGAEARTALEQGCAPDAIVLDLMMPVMDGWEFLDWKASSPFAALPVVVVTALNFDGDVTSLRERYGCEVLPKTGGVDALLALLRRHAG